MVVGVVNEELDPNQDRENDEDGDEPCREVMRDFLIQLEEQFHGEPAETLRIRAPYVPVDDQIAPELEEGDRYLFFLFKAPEDAGLPGAWGFDHQRAKEVSPYGEVIGGRQFETGVAGLDEIEQLIDESLSGERPDDDELPRSLWGWTEDAIDRGDQ